MSMRSFRNRQLLTESMGEADSLEAVEALEAEVAENIGNAEKADEEVSGLLDEGDALVEDTSHLEDHDDILEDAEEAGEEITEAHAETVELVTESFENRWNIERSPKRVMAFESYNGSRGQTRLLREGMGESIAKGWETFVKWCQNILDTIMDKYGEYMGTGNSFIKFATKSSEILGKNTKQKEGKDKVKAGYQKNFTIDGQVLIAETLAIAKRLPGDASGLMGWAENLVTKTKMVINLVQSSEGGKFDKELGKEGKDAPAFGKKIGKKLAPVGPKGSSEEMQAVYALPGNNYIQSFSYKQEGQGFVEGVRFIKAGDSISKAEEAEKEVPVIEINLLKNYADVLKGIGEMLKGIETSHKKSREASKSLIEEIKKTAAEFKKAPKDSDERKGAAYAKVLAREAFVTSQHSVNAATTTATVVGKGLTKLLSAHMGAYQAA